MRRDRVGCFIMVIIAAIGLFLLREMLNGGLLDLHSHRLTDVVDVLSGP